MAHNIGTCRACGGELELSEHSPVIQCKHCGNVMVWQQLTEKQREAVYQSACELADHPAIDEMQCQAAISRLEKLKDYRDSEAQAEKARVRLAQLKKARMEAAAQRAAIRKRRLKIAALLLAAAAVVSITVTLLVTKVIIPARDYAAAEELLAAGNYREAIPAFEKLEGEEEACEHAYACTYEAAGDYLAAGNLIEAYELLTLLGSYRDSAEIADSIYEDYKSEKMRLIQDGKTIFFGSYEQDRDKENGTEDIEWLVLEVDETNNKALVISQYALDCRYFDWENDDWEQSDLRKWLLEEFLNQAFTTAEQEKIRTEEGEDPIFLLDREEAEHYLPLAESRRCKPTNFAISMGAKVHQEDKTCTWWLRSTNSYTYYYWMPSGRVDVFFADTVGTDGTITAIGEDKTRTSTVRPAFWIDLNED